MCAQKPRGFSRSVTRVHFGTLCALLRKLRLCGEKTVYLSRGCISLCFGSLRARSRALHWIPLSFTASITPSTLLRRARARARRCPDMRHGFFHNRPPRTGELGRKAPNNDMVEGEGLHVIDFPRVPNSTPWSARGRSLPSRCSITLALLRRKGSQRSRCQKLGTCMVQMVCIFTDQLSQKKRQRLSGSLFSSSFRISSS